jgi:hypothetical protein
MGYAEIELPNGTTHRVGEEDVVVAVDPADNEDERQQVLAGLVLSGGRPYILITIDPPTGAAEITHYGFTDDKIGAGLVELGQNLIEAGR